MMIQFFKSSVFEDNSTSAQKMLTGFNTRTAQEKKSAQLGMLIGAFGLLKLLIHLFSIQKYGLHADELYYIEISKTSNWGFPDISPFVTWMASASEYFFGKGVVAFRIIPSIFSALTVMLTGYIAREIGGGKLAIILACSAMICSPAFLATSYLLQPAVFDAFFWTLFSFAVIAYQYRKKLIFVYLGSAALGFGMLNKYSILLLPCTLLLGVFILQIRIHYLRIKSLILPTLLFVIILSPNIIWQWAHGFPIFNYTAIVGKSAFKIDIPDYLFQLFFFHGASVAIWTAGFLFLIYDKKTARDNKIWPFAFVLIVLILSLLKGKLYYGLGIFPVLFAFGGYCWAIMLHKLNRASAIFFVGVMYVFALLSLPIVIPILKLQDCKQYVSEMVSLTGFTRPMRYEDGKQGKIPQFFADMSGWKELTIKMKTLTSEKNETTEHNVLILTDNYAIAGALRYYGGIDMPEVISTKNSFSTVSPSVIHNQTVIYLSKEPYKEVKLLGRKVRLLETLNSDNAHIDGMGVYKLTSPTAFMKLKYHREREAFFPYLTSILPQ